MKTASFVVTGASATVLFCSACSLFSGWGEDGAQPAPAPSCLTAPSFMATQAQMREAETRLTEASVAAVRRKHQYVAIRVHKSGGPVRGAQVMIYDSKTGKLANAKVYTLATEVTSGEVIRVGGRNALLL